MQFIANTAFVFSVQCLLACAFFAWFKPTGYFHVIHAIAVALGAFVATVGAASFEGAGALAVVLTLACLCGAALGASNAALFEAVRPSRERALFVLILSLGLYVVAQNIFSLMFGDQIQRWPVLPERLWQFGADFAFSLNQVVIMGAAFTMTIGLCLIWYATPLGRLARAIGDNAVLADVIGIKARQVTLGLAAISAAAAAGAGVLVASDAGITPSAGFNYVVPALTAVVLGGNRSMWSTIGGAAVVATAQTSTAYVFGSRWESFAVYVLLTAVLLTRPAGVFGVARARA